jgi:hypothetical protein
MSSSTPTMTKTGYRVIRVELDDLGKLVYSENRSYRKGDMFHSASHRDENEYFQWTSDVGSIEITFPQGHPFDGLPIRAEAGELTPPVQISREAELRHYKYDVKLTDKNGKTYLDDPVIVVHNDAEFAVPGPDDIFKPLL